MPIGGKLLLKGGKPLKPKKKKKVKKKIPEALVEETLEELDKVEKSEASKAPESAINPSAVAVQSGKTYEEEFSLEMKKAQEGKTRSTPWGSSFRTPPKLLHGYKHEVKGVNAEERLDMRCAMKGDKFCK